MKKVKNSKQTFFGRMFTYTLELFSINFRICHLYFSSINIENDVWERLSKIRGRLALTPPIGDNRIFNFLDIFTLATACAMPDCRARSSGVSRSTIMKEKQAEYGADMQNIIKNTSTSVLVYNKGIL